MKCSRSPARPSSRLVLAIAVASALFSLEALAAQRLALVVGNDAYQNITKLRNARNDAQAVAKELETAGFKVTRVLDATRASFNDQLDGFVRKIEKGDDVVFFFSGHGSQPPLRGPYLLPVDIKVTERSIATDGQSLELLLAELGAKSRFTLAIIDACRNDPFRETSTGRSMVAGSNLAMEAPRGTVVMMAASKGQEALDRLGNSDIVPNGVFTRELVKSMRQPGVTVNDMLRKVRFSVINLAKSVNHEQWPAIMDDSSADFYLYPTNGPMPTPAPTPFPSPAPSPAPAPSPTPTPAPSPLPRPVPAPAPLPAPSPAPRPTPSPSLSEAQREYDAWEAAQRANTRGAIEGFVTQFPQGRYLGMARQKLAGMAAAPAAAPAPVAAPKPAAHNPQVEYELFDKADTSKKRVDYEAYLAAYPNGRYVDLARAGLKTAK
jgi:hypothetical protein